MKKWMIALSAATLALTPAALAQTDKPAQKQAEPAKKLAVGDKAPALKVEKFIKGDPIKEFEKGKVYVVEFWATWCGPCVAAFPHLSEMQKEYKEKGVTFIGTNIWEDARGKSYSESTLSIVEEFVKKQGDKMSYTVAYDGGSKAMDTGWMKASGQRGIPSAMIVNQEGVIAYIGHPTYPEGVMEGVLKDVVDGKWSLEGAKKDAEKRAKQEEEEGAQMAGMNKFAMDFQKAAKAKDTKTMSELGTTAMGGMAKDNPMLLNLIAWSFVDPAAGFDRKDINLDLATKAAERANELTKGKDGAILDTLARVHFVKGDVAKAVELQTKAVELAPEEMKEELTKSLDEYKKAKR